MSKENLWKITFSWYFDHPQPSKPHLLCTAGCCSFHSSSSWLVTGRLASPLCVSLHTNKSCRRLTQTSSGPERWEPGTAGSGYVWTFSPALLLLNRNEASGEMCQAVGQFYLDVPKMATGFGDLLGWRSAGWSILKNKIRTTLIKVRSRKVDWKFESDSWRAEEEKIRRLRMFKKRNKGQWGRWAVVTSWKEGGVWRKISDERSEDREGKKVLGFNQVAADVPTGSCMRSSSCCVLIEAGGSQL